MEQVTTIWNTNDDGFDRNNKGILLSPQRAIDEMNEFVPLPLREHILHRLYFYVRDMNTLSSKVLDPFLPTNVYNDKDLHNNLISLIDPSTVVADAAKLNRVFDSRLFYKSFRFGDDKQRYLEKKSIECYLHFIGVFATNESKWH
jgi:hypothetical protein